MREHNISIKQKYNKRNCSESDKMNVLERNIKTGDSIEVTIMNNLNTNDFDTNVEDGSGKSEDYSQESDLFLLKVIFSNNKKYIELKGNVFNSIKQGLNRKHLMMKENDDKNMIEIFENDDKHIDQVDTDTNIVEAGSDLFTIDTEPEKTSQNAKKSKVIEIPVYSKDKFSNVLLMADSTNKKNFAPNKGKSNFSCFNCGDNHNLKDCTKPRNHAKIQQRLSQIKGGERYHIEPNQKYANVVPGKLSEELRIALGLRKNEIPSHVYRMRLFGYPPGWLEDHKISNSGLTLFDSDGKTVIGDSDEEQGEIVEKEKYDLNKIIDFPGFNVPPTKPNQYDDFHRNRVPPMSEFHSKEAMISFLSDKLVTPYKRKKLLNFPGANIKSDDNNIEEQCMDIEDDENFCGPPLPPTVQPLLDDNACESNPPLPPPDNTIMIDSDESGEIISEDDDDTNNTKQAISLKATPLCNDSSEKTIENRNDGLLETISSDVSFENLCTTKFETNGTPLLQFSPYTSLPSGDKFSVGVSDVINFENLPDSTGKYETMKEILKRVRNQMEKLHDEL